MSLTAEARYVPGWMSRPTMCCPSRKSAAGAGSRRDGDLDRALRRRRGLGDLEDDGDRLRNDGRPTVVGTVINAVAAAAAQEVMEMNSRAAAVPASSTRPALRSTGPLLVRAGGRSWHARR